VTIRGNPVAVDLIVAPVRTRPLASRTSASFGYITIIIIIIILVVVVIVVVVVVVVIIIILIIIIIIIIIISIITVFARPSVMLCLLEANADG
jgi:hypothetical protein